ncbi:hypothetical protein HAX54_050186, partial [Datura stramonium]|nr:hypothetical protein [Datura stramonium]
SQKYKDALAIDAREVAAKTNAFPQQQHIDELEMSHTLPLLIIQTTNLIQAKCSVPEQLHDHLKANLIPPNEGGGFLISHELD